MMDHGSGGETSRCGVRGQFLVDTRASKLQGSTATITGVLITFSSSAGY